MTPVVRKRLLIAVMAVGAVVLLGRFDPEKTVWFPKCVLVQTTGIYCPGCGTSRALHALMEGRVADALRMNALMIVALPLLATMFIRPEWFRRPWIGWTAFGVLLGYAILRNLPMWPFHLLAPH